MNMMDVGAICAATIILTYAYMIGQLRSIIMESIAIVGIVAILSCHTARAADTVIINNYPAQTDRFCWGLMCLVAPSIWAEQDRQAREAQGPHPCSVWNGRAWVGATCAP